MDVGEILVLKMIPSAGFPSSVIPPTTLILEYVRASITIQHGWGLDELLPVLAPLALEEVVRLQPRRVSVESSIVARGTHLAGGSVELEELSQVVTRVVSLDAFLLIDDARRQVLLVGLTLEDWEEDTSV